MTNDLISVIIPFYNTYEFLSRCLDSVINQTYKNIEIIVVNDGSTDKSEEIVFHYKQLDDRIKYYYKENSGCGLTRNYGLDKAKGKYIYFLDSDDYIAPTMLEKLHNAIKPEDTFSGILQFYYDINGKLKLLKMNEQEHRTLKSPAVWSRLFNKITIDESCIRFSDAKIGEDLEFVFKLLIYNNHCTYIDDEPLYYYRLHQSSISNNNNINVLSILNVIDSIETYAKRQNKFDEFYDLIEFTNIFHIFFAIIKLEKQNNREELNKCLTYLASKYPNWKNNIFVNTYFVEQANTLQMLFENLNYKNFQ